MVHVGDSCVWDETEERSEYEGEEEDANEESDEDG